MKTKVYVWKNSVKMIDMKPRHDKNQGNSVNNRGVTPAENAANVISSMLPSCDVESLVRLIAQAARYSIEIGENDAAMENRLYQSIMAVTSESKNNFS